MPNWPAAGCALALSLGAAALASAAGSAQDSWLMMVTTENTDAARAAEFNDWYDKVDIPDVLEVPGYERARRGEEQRIPEYAAADSAEARAKYVALYDIRSRAIDKTIIDMLMASWGMEKAHHSTELLKVTERVYFHQYGAVHAAPIPKPPAAQQYIYMVRFDCCRDPVAARHFDVWYERRYVPAVLASPGFTRVARYKLYRVLMDHPVRMSDFLGVFEIAADSAAQAASDVSEVRSRLTAADRGNLSILEANRSLFLQIKDARRP